MPQGIVPGQQIQAGNRESAVELDPPAERIFCSACGQRRGRIRSAEGALSQPEFHNFITPSFSRNADARRDVARMRGVAIVQFRPADGGDSGKARRRTFWPTWGAGGMHPPGDGRLFPGGESKTTDFLRKADAPG
jgi:hypothetical protein